MNREKQIEEIAKITKVHCELDNQCGSCHWETCNECLAEVLYNAGYRKQSEGEWNRVDDTIFGHESYRCSSCNYRIGVPRKKPNYCPNCGAKMKGGAE